LERAIDLRKCSMGHWYYFRTIEIESKAKTIEWFTGSWEIKNKDE
jgi:hypothetical protein